MRIKTLVKKMTYVEAEEYVVNHQQWRLPTKYINDCKLSHYWLKTEEPITYSSGVHLYNSSLGLANNLVKLPVVLIPSVDDIDISSIFWLTKKESNDIREVTDSKFIGVKDIAQYITHDKMSTELKNRLAEILLAMKDEDFVSVR